MSTHNLCFEQNYEKYQNFYLKNLYTIEALFSIWPTVFDLITTLCA